MIWDIDLIFGMTMRVYNHKLQINFEIHFGWMIFGQLTAVGLWNLAKYLVVTTFLCPHDEKSGGILIYPCPSVRPSGYTGRYMVCPAISSYSFGATALIFCRIFIHIMEVCMSTGFWFSSNILKMTGSWP